VFEPAVGIVAEGLPVAVAVFQPFKFQDARKAWRRHAEIAVDSVDILDHVLSQFGADQVVAFGRAVVACARRHGRESHAAALVVAVVHRFDVATRVALDGQLHFVRQDPSSMRERIKDAYESSSKLTFRPLFNKYDV